MRLPSNPQANFEDRTNKYLAAFLKQLMSFTPTIVEGNIPGSDPGLSEDEINLMKKSELSQADLQFWRAMKARGIKVSPEQFIKGQEFNK